MKQKYINDRMMKAVEDYNKYLQNSILYAGMVDLETGKTISLDKIDPRNMNLRGSKEQLLKSYPKAIEAIELSQIYLECFDIGKEDMGLLEKIIKNVESGKKMVEAIINHAVLHLPE